MVSGSVKRLGKQAIARSPYRTHFALPTMLPLAPALVEAGDRVRARRAPERHLASLAHSHPPAEIERHATCPLCGHDGVRMQDRRTRGGYFVGQCGSCGLWYRVPGIRPERVPDLYSTGGYSDFLDGDYSQGRQDLYRLVLGSFTPRFDDGDGRTLLDFGCGVGLFMEVAAERGFDVHGVDLAPDAVEAAGRRFGEERVAGDPSGLGPGTPERFDVITMISVLAHIAEPKEQIRALYDRMEPGGNLLIYTVNSDALERKAFGWRWTGFTTNHLIFWDERNLGRMLREVGFSDVEHRHFLPVPLGLPTFSSRLTQRHRRAVERCNGGNMLHVVATK